MRQLRVRNSRELCECATSSTATSSRSLQALSDSARGQTSSGAPPAPRLWMVAREVRGMISIGGEGGEGLVMRGTGASRGGSKHRLLLGRPLAQGFSKIF